MKKVIKIFVMFLLALVLFLGISNISVNAEEPTTDDATAEDGENSIEDIINGYSPMTEDQKTWVRQYLSEYVDENVVEVIITVLSALAILIAIAIALIKLVNKVNLGLKNKTEQTETFNAKAETIIKEYKAEIEKQKLTNESQNKALIEVSNKLDNALSKIDVIALQYEELQKKETDRIEKASLIAERINKKFSLDKSEV